MSTRTADVVVIGGGVNGCSAAYHLAKSGVKKVVLVEKGHIASGPTGLSSGIVRQHYTLEPLAMMARDSVRVLANFRELLGGEAGFVQCGVVFLAGSGGEDVMRESVAMHQRIGIEEELLNAAELKDLEPQINTEGISCGAYELRGGYADPALVANSFAAAAEREGAEILRTTEVTGITVAGGRVRAVITNKGVIATERVANIAGPWGKRIAAMAGVDLPITASRHPVLVVDRPHEWRTPTPVCGDLVTGWYFKPEGRHGMMAGSLTEVEADTNVVIETYSMRTSYDETVPYSEAMLHRFPVMANGTTTAGWAGLYDVTPDGLPVIDQIPGVDGFFCAVGWNGHGFKTSPATGALMAELITTGACSTYDISIFRYNRFAERSTVRTKAAYAIIG
jgi:glycine/D-amino acid oxidase-like deaminating enzyme